MELSYWLEVRIGFKRCNWSGAEGHDDSYRCGWQWDSDPGGMGERRHDQYSPACAAWTEGTFRQADLWP